MSQILFSELITFVQIHLPSFPNAKTGTAANWVIEELYERLNQVYYSTFTTRAATTTGTVNVTSGQTAVTFSSGVLVTTDGMRLVQIEGESTWYVVTRNAADTAGVLSSAFAGTTNATATYQIIYPTITFPATVGTILRVGSVDGTLELGLAAAQDRNRIFSGQTVGTPLFYNPYAFDDGATPNDAHRIILTPFPNTQRSYEYEYDARATLIDPAGATTQAIAIPTSFRPALYAGTLSLCWLAQDQESADRWEAKFEQAVRKALATKGKEVSGRRVGIAGISRRYDPTWGGYPRA